MATGLSVIPLYSLERRFLSLQSSSLRQASYLMLATTAGAMLTSDGPEGKCPLKRMKITRARAACFATASWRAPVAADVRAQYRREE